MLVSSEVGGTGRLTLASKASSQPVTLVTGLYGGVNRQHHLLHRRRKVNGMVKWAEVNGKGHLSGGPVWRPKRGKGMKVIPRRLGNLCAVPSCLIVFRAYS